MDYQLVYLSALETIQLTMNTAYTGTLFIMDLQGRTVSKEVVNASFIEIPCSKLTKGLYFVRLGDQAAKRILTY